MTLITSTLSLLRQRSFHAVWLPTIGVTLSSFTTGSNSSLYLLTISLTLIFSLIFFFTGHRVSNRSLTFVALLSFMLLLLWLMQAFVFMPQGYQPLEAVRYFLAMIIVLCTVVVAGVMEENVFEKTMEIIAVFHIAVLLYGMIDGDALQIIRVEFSERFETDSFSVAVWAEIALGTILAAILSRNRLILFMSVIVGGTIIFATQMRIVGISAGLAISLIFIFPQSEGVSENRYKLRSSGLIILLMSIFILFYGPIYNLISEVLLFDDPHRGIQSGFSGRFDNFREGFTVFLSSPIIGVGPLDASAGYTHNGYIKALAQHGIFFGATLIALLIRSIVQCITHRHTALLSAILALAIFLIGQPRYLNFQLMPLIGLYAVSRGNFVSKQARS